MSKINLVSYHTYQWYVITVSWQLKQVYVSRLLLYHGHSSLMVSRVYLTQKSLHVRLLNFSQLC